MLGVEAFTVLRSGGVDDLLEVADGGGDFTRDTFDAN